MNTDQYTINQTMLPVGDGHTLSVQLWGSPEAAETIIFLHGGPGGGCSDKHKLLFDPLKQQVVFFDQRGCGKSLPYGSLEANDTAHMIEDIRTIAARYKLEAFTLTGGSWGSCLALAYAVKYPQQVTRLVLRGIFTARQREIDYLDKGEFRTTYPEVWESFLASVPTSHRNNPVAYHRPRILGDDPIASKASAYAYSILEGSLISLDDRSSVPEFDEFDPASTKIECHYSANNCFLPEGYIMDNASKLSMPVSLIQGRYDMVCPPFTAYELAQKLPNARLYWTIAGHSGYDRPNWDLTRALLAESSV